MKSIAMLLTMAVMALAAPMTFGEEFMGITIAPENRCAPYNKKRDYPYSQSVEDRVIAEYGGVVYGPYENECFANKGETDIEHMVAAAEAHDSGMCAATAAKKREFASDLLNLTLASPTVNRHRKSGKDVAEWLPEHNKCWYVNRTIEVRRKYGMTIDRREADEAREVLEQCDSVAMVLAPCASGATPAPRVEREVKAEAKSELQEVLQDAFVHEPKEDDKPFEDDVFKEEEPPSQQGKTDALGQWDDNGNGRITCAEARRHGIAPVYEDHPAYPYMRDGNKDGVVCE